MKIIIPNIPIPILYDIAQCLESIARLSHLDVSIWDVNTKSVIDAIDERQPDIVFIHHSQLDRSFAELCDDLSFKYVVVSTVGLPHDLPQQPDAILTYPQFSHLFTSNNVIEIRSVARIPQIHDAQYDKDMKSEVLFNTSGLTIDNTIQEILFYLVSTYNTKIIGDVPIGLHQYLGKVDMFERANFIKSAQSVVDLGGFDYWDAAYLQTPAIATNVSNNAILSFNNISTLTTHLNSILHNTLVRTKYIEQCYQEVFRNTSYHFTANLYNVIDEKPLSDTLLQYLKELI